MGYIFAEKYNLLPWKRNELKVKQIDVDKIVIKDIDLVFNNEIYIFGILFRMW